MLVNVTVVGSIKTFWFLRGTYFCRGPDFREVGNDVFATFNFPPPPTTTNVSLAPQLKPCVPALVQKSNPGANSLAKGTTSEGVYFGAD